MRCDSRHLLGNGKIAVVQVAAGSPLHGAKRCRVDVPHLFSTFESAACRDRGPFCIDIINGLNKEKMAATQVTVSPASTVLGCGEEKACDGGSHVIQITFAIETNCRFLQACRYVGRLTAS
jgi:hypothetical protein